MYTRIKFLKVSGHSDFKIKVEKLYAALLNKIKEEHRGNFQLTEIPEGYVIETTTQLEEREGSELREPVIKALIIRESFPQFDACLDYFDLFIRQDNDPLAALKTLLIFFEHNIHDIPSLRNFFLLTKQLPRTQAGGEDYYLVTLAIVIPCINFARIKRSNCPNNVKIAIENFIAFLLNYSQQPAFGGLFLTDFFRFKDNPELLKVMFESESLQPFVAMLTLILHKMTVSQELFDRLCLLDNDAQLLELILSYGPFVDLLFPRKPHDQSLFHRWSCIEAGWNIFGEIFKRHQFIKENHTRILTTLCYLPVHRVSLFSVLFQESGLPKIQVIIAAFDSLKISSTVEEHESVHNALFKGRSVLRDIPLFQELMNNPSRTEREIIKRFLKLFSPSSLVEYLDRSPQEAMSNRLDSLQELVKQSRDKSACQAWASNLQGKKSKITLAQLVELPSFFDVFLQSEVNVSTVGTSDASAITPSALYYWVKWSSTESLLLQLLETPAAEQRLIKHPALIPALTQLSADNTNALQLLLQKPRLKSLLVMITTPLIDYIHSNPHQFLTLCFQRATDKPSLSSCLLIDIAQDPEFFKTIFNDKTQAILLSALSTPDYVDGSTNLVKSLDELSHLFPLPVISLLAEINRTHLLQKLANKDKESFLNLVKDPKTNRKALAEAFQVPSFLASWNKLELSEQAITAILEGTLAQIFSRVNSKETYLKDLLTTILCHPQIAATVLDINNTELTLWYKTNIAKVPQTAVAEEPITTSAPAILEITPPKSETETEPEPEPLKPSKPAKHISKRKQRKAYQTKSNLTSVATKSIETITPVDSDDEQTLDVNAASCQAGPPALVSSTPSLSFFKPEPELEARLATKIMELQFSPVESPKPNTAALLDDNGDSTILNPGTTQVNESLLQMELASEDVATKKKLLIASVWSSQDEHFVRQLINESGYDSEVIAPRGEPRTLNNLKLTYLFHLLGLHHSLIKKHFEIISGAESLFSFFNDTNSSTWFIKRAIHKKSLNKFLNLPMIQAVSAQLHELIPIAKILTLCDKADHEKEPFMTEHLKLVGLDEQAIQQTIDTHQVEQQLASRPRLDVPVIVASLGEQLICEFIGDYPDADVPVVRVIDNCFSLKKFTKDNFPIRKLLMTMIEQLQAEFLGRVHIAIVGSQGAFQAAGQKKLNPTRDLDLNIVIGGFDDLNPACVPFLAARFIELLKNLSDDPSYKEGINGVKCILGGYNREGNAWLSYKALCNGIDIDIRIVFSKHVDLSYLKQRDLSNRCLSLSCFSVDLLEEATYAAPKQFDFVKPYNELTIDNVAYTIWTLATYRQKNSNYVFEFSDRFKAMFHFILQQYQDNALFRKEINTSFGLQFGRKMREDSQPIKHIGHAFGSIANQFPRFALVKAPEVPQQPGRFGLFAAEASFADPYAATQLHRRTEQGLG